MVIIERMPINTDNSGSARAARLRQIAASKGPIPAVRPNIGSMALDAQLGKMGCCPPLTLTVVLKSASGTGPITDIFELTFTEPISGSYINTEMLYVDNNSYISNLITSSKTSSTVFSLTIRHALPINSQSVYLIVTIDGNTYKSLIFTLND